jgi:hypothetical protein
MEKFFKDKPKLFECKLAIEGADLNNTQARLVLQFENKTNLLFYGEVDNNGKCKINIPALKENYGTKGKALLEVIADSTYFESWNDDFNIEASKKVVVERIESEKPVISTPKVTVQKEDTQVNIIENFSKYLIKNNINISNLKEKQKSLPNLLESYIKQNNPLKEDLKHLISNIGKCVEYLK